MRMTIVEWMTKTEIVIFFLMGFFIGFASGYFLAEYLIASSLESIGLEQEIINKWYEGYHNRAR